MDGAETLWNELKGRLSEGVQAAGRLFTSGWSRVADSPRIPLLPGVAVFAGLNVSALLLLWHRETARLPLSPGTGLMLTSGVLLSGLSVQGRRLLENGGWLPTSCADRWLLGVFTAFPGLVLASAGLGTSLTGTACVLLATVVATLVVAAGDRLTLLPRSLRRLVADWALGSAFQEKDLMANASEVELNRPRRLAAASADGMHPVLWLQRAADARGTERLEGLMRVEFPEGQSTTTVHVAFCPPFRQTPAFRCDVDSTARVRIRASVAYAYGARVELKRSGPVDDSLTLELDFCATASLSLSKAA